MFREMRRFKQALSKEEVEEVLDRGTNGVLGCVTDEDYPYTVPISYVYHDGRIYFHSAKSGQKVDAMKHRDKVSFTVVDKDQIVSEEYTTYFRSVMIFGRARIADGHERDQAFAALVEKYSGDQPKESKFKEVHECGASFIFAIDIEHMTGKEAIELVKAKKSQTESLK